MFLFNFWRFIPHCIEPGNFQEEVAVISFIYWKLERKVETSKSDCWGRDGKSQYLYLFIYLFASTVTKLSIYSEERKCVIFLRKERFRQGRCNVRHSGLGNPVDIPYHLLPSCTFHFKFYSPIVGLWIYHVLEMPGAWIAWNVMMPRYHLANSISWLLPWLWCVAAMERLSFFCISRCCMQSEFMPSFFSLHMSPYRILCCSHA